jgi:enoyl-CoA hydratase/carnithine racemase
MNEPPILTEIKENVYKIIINRPSKLNSITSDMLDLFSIALEEANKAKNVRCILITGAGDRAFSAGADINDFLKMDVSQAKEFSKKGQSTLKKILLIPKPVIAAINGYALGGGFELTQYCDIRLASEKARFSQPEVNLGLMPGWGGTYMLKKLIGETLAREMIMTGRRLTAQEALEVGLLSHVFSNEEFHSKITQYIDSILKGPPISLASMKKLFNKDPNLEKAFNEEAIEFSNLWKTNDLIEGIKAFNEKRKPDFQGK